LYLREVTGLGGIGGEIGLTQVFLVLSTDLVAWWDMVCKIKILFHLYQRAPTTNKNKKRKKRKKTLKVGKGENATEEGKEKKVRKKNNQKGWEGGRI
jgi:hypothetical protein